MPFSQREGKTKLRNIWMWALFFILYMSEMTARFGITFQFLISTGKDDDFSHSTNISTLKNINISIHQDNKESLIIQIVR